MKFRYDYRCPLDGYFEAFREREASYTPCPECGTPAKRMPSVPAVFTDSAGNQPSGEPLRD